MSTERVKVTVTTSYILVTIIPELERERKSILIFFNLNETWDHIYMLFSNLLLFNVMDILQICLHSNTCIWFHSLKIP